MKFLKRLREKKAFMKRTKLMFKDINEFWNECEQDIKERNNGQKKY